jgi:hypothetical protein
MLYHQQPKQHLGGRGKATMDQREAIAVRQVGPHLRIQLIVVEQVVQLN